MNDAPLPGRPADLRETLLTFPSPAPSVLLRKTADYESGGRRFESFRARHLTSCQTINFRIGSQRPQTKISV